MLKHVSATTLTRRRTVSPAPSSTSISTLDSSSSSSTCSSPSSTSSSVHSTTSSTGDSWRNLGECRTYSRLSITDREPPTNTVPLRIYAATLRPDIQYKTIGVTGSTTCSEVIGALLTKCKVRFKDPRLFQLSMQVEIRCADGCSTRASINLEDGAIPLQLHECYPRGQARFILNTKQGALVKIFDESNTVGWQYKSVLISEQTTASELLDILFRFSIKDQDEVHFYALHLETKDRRRPLVWNEAVVPAKEAASRSQDEVRVILRSQAVLPFASIQDLSSNLLRMSTLSLYDNVTLPRPPNQTMSTTGVTQLETTTLGRFHYSKIHQQRRHRSQSFSENSSSTNSSDSFYLLQPSSVPSSARVTVQNPFSSSLTDSVLATLTKLGRRADRHGKYDLSVSEAFFV